MLSLGLSLALLSQGPPPVQRLTIDGRLALVTLPNGHQERRSWPLVVLLHGYGGNAQWLNNYTGFSSLARSEGFVVVTPEGTGSPAGWNARIMDLGKPGVDDLAHLRKVIARVIRDYRIDRKQVFVAGHSNGGMMAIRLAASGEPRVRAIATVGGILGVGAKGRETTIPPPKSSFCVLKIHGFRDQVVGYGRDSVALIRGISGLEETEWWAKHMLQRAKPSTTGTAKIRTTVYQQRDRTVQLVTLVEHGHTWPTTADGGYAATREIWKFFSSRR